MHILYIHQYFSTPDGSSGTRSYEMAKRLIFFGHKVTMVCGHYAYSVSGVKSEFIKGKRSGIVDEIEVIEFDLPHSNHTDFLTRIKLFTIFALNCIRLALTMKYDLLFATSTPLTVAIPGIVMKLFRKKPFIFEIRDLWPELPREMKVITNQVLLKAMDILEWFAYHSADACIALSPGIVQGIANRNVPLSKITMIPNGCDLEIFKPDKRRSKIESINGIEKNDFVALFSGAHGIANGLDAVLDTAKILLQKNEQNIKILFIGDGKLKPALRKRAEKEGLVNCIFCDLLPKRELAEITATADVGLMVLANIPAFYRGTSPNKFFDYISSGIPVLNNYPGWLAEKITGNNCGIALPPENPMEFAGALIYLRNNPEEKIKMGRNARAFAEKEFNREKLADQFVRFLEKIYQESAQKN